MHSAFFMRYIFIFALLIASTGLIAQPQLYTDAGLTVPEVAETATFRPNGTPNTLTISTLNPFYDDFSNLYESVDTAKWYLSGDNRQPLIYRRGAINPPTMGVVTFDGLNAQHNFYNTSLASGWGDELVSHYFDLSGYTPADSIILSFYLEPQGKGEAPEPIDVFRVEFADNQGNWVNVAEFAGNGSTPITGFTQHMLPLDNPFYFHSQFQVRFRTKGSLNGHIDIWHLDYVYLGVGRSVLDSAVNDVAIVDIDSSIFKPYTALAYQQFVGQSLMQPFEIQLSNLRNTSATLGLTAKITDPVGNNLFSSGNLQSTVSVVNPLSDFAQGFNAFSDQTLVPYTGSYYLSVNLPPDLDPLVKNNFFTESFRVDSLIAYDDGEPEGSYGIANEPRGFGQKYTFNSPDSLMAVWINFAPRINYNPVTGQSINMEDYLFRLVVWNKPHPDSILYQQVANMKVHYGDSVRQFFRYALSRPLSLSGDVWIGIQQQDIWAIGVGFDTNRDNHALIYWDSLSNWVPSRIPGTLMIRPEMQNIQYHPLVAGIASPQGQSLGAHISPNPTHQNIEISLPEHLRTYAIEIMDLQGKSVWKHTVYAPAATLNLTLPVLPEGMYIVRHTGSDMQGNTLFSHERLIIHP